MITDENKILPWCGIYTVVNVHNGKRYIGQTTRSFHERWKEEINEVKFRKKYGVKNCNMSKFNHIIGTILDDSDNKYIKISNTEAYFGCLHFKRIQEWCNTLTKEELFKNEHKCIEYWDSYNNGYNSRP